MHIFVLFFRIFVGLTAGLLCLLACLVGAVAVFSSFFFEETRAQMNAGVWMEHALVFLGGMAGVSLGVGGFFLLASNGFLFLGRSE